LGFPVCPLREKVDGPHGCLGYFTRISKVRSDLDYELDSIVYIVSIEITATTLKVAA